MRVAADSGDPQAMLHRARALIEGLGTPEDPSAGEALLRKAAASGLTSAQEALGAWLADRHKAGEKIEASEPATWLEPTYRDGHSVTALTRLATFLAYEVWGEREFQRSVELLRLCLGTRNAQCHYGYAWRLKIGHGMRPDPVEAYTHSTSRDVTVPRERRVRWSKWRKS
jgi:TPR repeat protein